MQCETNIIYSVSVSRSMLLSFMLCLLSGFSTLGQTMISRIAFGSCGSQDHPLPVFDVINKHAPDIFIFLGDNIYGDTENMDTLRAKYKRLEQKPGFQKLLQSARLYATWDDHDYGANDAGRHYPKKQESKEIFMEFFMEPAHSERRQHEGLYHSQILSLHGKKLQIILLDTRTFRDNLLAANGKRHPKRNYIMDYLPYEKGDSTLLGTAQWQWLEGELKKEADLRLICSGTQFAAQYNGYETWANFPHEQLKMLELIKSTKAVGVLFLSGDVHYAEISRLSHEGLYPVYDITASGLSSTWKFSTPNHNRVKGPVMENHFGLLRIDWMPENPSISMEIWDVRDEQRIEFGIRLNELTFKQ